MTAAPMRVISQDTFGRPDVLYVTEAPVPTPIATEALDRTRAAGVKPVDWKACHILRRPDPERGAAEPSTGPSVSW